MNFKVFKALSLRTKRAVLSYSRKVYSEALQRSIAKMPMYELSDKHIRNASIVLNRDVLIEKFPIHSVVAELGVDEGDYSDSILRICKPKKLHLIDCWNSKRYDTSKQARVEERFRNQIQSGIVEIHKDLSTQAVNLFPDKYFDWIYIDSNHSYKNVSDELRLYMNKIRRGGIIAGHDFTGGSWSKLIKFGVIEAVYEFCVRYDWEILYLTAENRENPSFAIRRISDGEIE